MNYLILTTANGRSFGHKVSSRLRGLLGTNDHVYRYHVSSLQEAFDRHPEFSPDNLIIHSRAANPTAQWMSDLVGYEREGYRVVNTTAALRLTSDKWKSTDLANRIGVMGENHRVEVATGLAHQNDRGWFNNTGWDRIKNGLWARETGKVVIKPRISQGQGRLIRYLDIRDNPNLDTLYEAMGDDLPNQVLVQEMIPVMAIYRVVVIGNRVFETGITVDRVTSEHPQVSVCLNRNQRLLTVNDNQVLIHRLSTFASRVVGAFGGEINFVDIFQTTGDNLILSEVNTACNLSIHSRLTGFDFAGHIAAYIYMCRPLAGG